jgi:hypothetical protein
MIRGTARAGPSAAPLVLGLAVLAAATVTGTRPGTVALLVAALAILLASHRALLRWHNLFAIVIGVVWFVPIRIYKLPANLPFDLELYRLVVALLLFAWAASLLVDLRVRLHRSPFDAPLALVVAAVIGSDVANPSRVSSLGSDVAKALMFFLSFVLLYYFAVSVLRDRAVLERIVRVLTGCATVVGAGAIVERRTGYNVFYHLHTVARFLQFQPPSSDLRGGHLRVFASAEHPIALGAALAMAVPLSLYLARTSSPRWWLSAIILVLGIMGTTSRTAIIMLGVIVVILFWLQREEIVRLWPAIFPLLIVIHIATPGAIGTLRYLFNPPGGIVSQQTRLPTNANPLLAGGRVRLLGPSLDEASRKPLLGDGWGTRLTGFDNPNRNAPILDNAWLGTLLEIGGIGIGGLVWLIVRAVRSLGRASRTASPTDSRLYAALAASIAAFAVGMLTYDAFSFIQVTFLFWMMLAIAAAALSIERPVGDASPLHHPAPEAV